MRRIALSSVIFWHIVIFVHNDTGTAFICLLHENKWVTPQMFKAVNSAFERFWGCFETSRFVKSVFMFWIASRTSGGIDLSEGSHFYVLMIIFTMVVKSWFPEVIRNFKSTTKIGGCFQNGDLGYICRVWDEIYTSVQNIFFFETSRFVKSVFMFWIDSRTFGGIDLSQGSHCG